MNNSTCNICNYNGPFLSHRKTPNRRCPECASLERHRNFVDYIKNNDLLINKYILHIAPEKSLNQFIRNKSEKYYCLDKTPNRLYMPKDDMTNLNIFKEDTFDIIICFHVLEHIIDDIKAISEIKRVLKPNGLAFISVPLEKESLFTYTWTKEDIDKQKKDGIWGIAGKYEGHYRTYGQTDLNNLLKQYFTEIKLSNNEKMTSQDFFICKK
jgi:ubiquinone/menaquinone biosynthesis C-methylase UbiE